MTKVLELEYLVPLCGLDIYIWG